MRSDGTVVDTSGTASPRFWGIPYDSVYVVLRSRNHLPLMTPEKVKIADWVWTHHFTVSADAAFSGDGPGLKPFFDGPFGLFAGDSDANGVLDVLDTGDYFAQTAAGVSGYQTADFNLDGKVQATDFNLYIANEVEGPTSQVP